MEEDKEGENVVEDRNYLMNFVLQLENVAGEDDKSDIQRLWIMNMIMNMLGIMLEKN